MDRDGRLPGKRKSPSLLLSFGKKLKEHRYIYFVIGCADKGQVEGYKDLGSILESYATIHYSVYQFTAGYLYTIGKSRIKLGGGPSLLMLKYTAGSEQSQTSFVPGLTLSGRFPLGKEKRLIGVDFILEANLAPPAKIEMQEKSDNGFHITKADMIQGSAGLALCFRK